MQPAHGYWPAQIDPLLQNRSITIGRKVGRKPQGPQGRELGLCTGTVAVHGADGVVFIVGADLAPEAGEHGAATGEVLPVPSSGGVVVLDLPGHRQGMGRGLRSRWRCREGLPPGRGFGEDRWVGSNDGEPQLSDALELLRLAFQAFQNCCQRSSVNGAWAAGEVVVMSARQQSIAVAVVPHLQLMQLGNGPPELLGPPPCHGRDRFSPFTKRKSRYCQSNARARSDRSTLLHTVVHHWLKILKSQQIVSKATALKG